MAYHNRAMTKNQELVLLGILLAASMVLGYVERLIPFDFIVPGVKLGLANVVVVVGLYLFPLKRSFLLAILKSATNLLIAGLFVSFIYGFTGTLLSFLGMLAMKKFIKGSTVVQTSIVGGILHNVGQLAAAIAVTRTVQLVAYFPVLLISGVITGLLIGVSASQLMVYLKLNGSKG